MLLLCANTYSSIVEGIFIGGAGGAIAGIAIWGLHNIQKCILKARHKCRVYKWMKKETKDELGSRFRSTRVIASWNNLTEDRVRFICSTHKEIYQSIGKDGEMWGIYGRDEKNIKSDRLGFTVI